MAYIPPIGAVSLVFVEEYPHPHGGDTNVEFDPATATKLPRAVGRIPSAVAFGAATAYLTRRYVLVGESSSPPRPGRPQIAKDSPRIRPEGIPPTLAIGAVAAVWDQSAYPPSIDDPQAPTSVRRIRIAGGYEPPTAFNLIVNWSGETYTPPIGFPLTVDFGALGYGRILGVTLFEQTLFGDATVAKPSGAAALGWVSSSVGAPLIQTSSRTLYVSGFSSFALSTPVIATTAAGISVGGIAPLPQTGPASQRRLPSPTIWFRIRTLVVTNGVASIAVPSPALTHWTQYINFASRGIPPGIVPEAARVEFRDRTIAPPFFVATTFGAHAIVPKLVIEGAGWESSAFSDNAELLINTRRIYAHSETSAGAGIGTLTVFNWTQNIRLHNFGWYDTQWSFPVLYNLKQHLTVGPFADNVSPTVWPNYEPHVENIDRVMSTFGHISSRINHAAWIYNNAVPVFPVGSDLTQWGEDTFISHGVRTVLGQGWDSFYNERYTVVWNLADVLAPTSVGVSSTFGRPDPVLNLNREIKHHSGWSGPEWGVPFVADGVRYLLQRPFNDIPAAFPEIRLNPFPITPVGVPWQGQVGGHEARIFRREAFPYAVNVHVPWFGEPVVRNRNLTVGPYGYDQQTHGLTDVQLYVRSVLPASVDPIVPLAPFIGYRTRTVALASFSSFALQRFHWIRNLLPDPPSTQVILLNATDDSGAEVDGFGIPPGSVSPGTIKLRAVFPPSLLNVSTFGLSKVYSTTLETEFFQSDGAVGTPTLIYSRQVFVADYKYLPRIGQPRMSPHNIYAPQGTEKPSGYTPASGGRTMDSHLSAFDNGGHPWFGRTAVSNQYRSMAASSTSSSNKWGRPSLELILKRVYPDGIRSLRTGFPVFLGVPQYVTLAGAGFSYGIAPHNEFGGSRIARWVDPLAPRPVQPSSFTGTYGSNRVELLNRTVEPVGIVHRGNPQQGLTSPWGTALVGFPRRYTVGMGVQSLWGTLVIEYVNRPVYPNGWNSCSLEDWNFDDYFFPMKVVRRNPVVVAQSVGQSSVFGGCAVTQFHRSVAARGIDGYNSGAHSVAASSSISPSGWLSEVVGDVDRWEAGKIKAHGDDLSSVGTPRMLHAVRADGWFSATVGSANAASGIAPSSIQEPVTFGPTLSDPTGCTNRAMSVHPIISTQTVPAPVVA